jgi:hypothetical protein
MRRLAIRRAADGDHDALDFLLRGFIRKAKQGRDPVAHVVADVLERVLSSESGGKILGTQAKRGRPRTYKKAILIHAMVQHLMLLRSQRPGRTQLQGDDARAAVAELLGMSPDTVRDNYRRVSRLIKTIRDKSPFIDLKRSGFSAMEEAYITCGVEVRANRRKRHSSPVAHTAKAMNAWALVDDHAGRHFSAWYKNFLENIIEAIRTPDLTQAPANGGRQVLMMVTLRYPLDRQESA